MYPDIMFTGFVDAKSGRICIGDLVAIFALGPIGLGALARTLNADHVTDFKRTDPVEEIRNLTERRGVGCAIETLGTQPTFENTPRVLRPRGTRSSVDLFFSSLTISMNAFGVRHTKHKTVTSLCPGGKERMWRTENVVASGEVDLTPRVEHRFNLEAAFTAVQEVARRRIESWDNPMSSCVSRSDAMTRQTVPEHDADADHTWAPRPASLGRTNGSRVMEHWHGNRYQRSRAKARIGWGLDGLTATDRAA